MGDMADWINDNAFMHETIGDGGPMHAELEPPYVPGFVFSHEFVGDDAYRLTACYEDVDPYESDGLLAQVHVYGDGLVKWRIFMHGDSRVDADSVRAIAELWGWHQRVKEER